MVERITIPLGGQDVSGRPLPPTTTYLTGDGGAGIGNWEPYKPPSQGEPTPSESGTTAPTGNWEPYVAPQQTAPEAPAPVSTGDAVTQSLAHGASFGFAPAIQGLTAAAGAQGEQAAELPTDTASLSEASGIAPLIKPFVGAYQMLTGATDRIKAYNEARDKALKAYEEAQKQHPYATLAGELAGGLAVTPALGPLTSLRGASILGRVAQGVKVGGVTGGLTGAGGATSRGESPTDVAKAAGVGAGVGGILGGATGGAIETATGAARGVGNLLRSHRDAELEAARQVADVMRRGAGETARIAADRPALQAGVEAGTPVFNVDVAGAPARRLLRATTNVSPEAQDVAGQALFPRFQAQSERIGDWVLGRFGGGDVGQTLQQLKNAARSANKPNYDRAMAASDRVFPGGMWSTPGDGVRRPAGALSLQELAQAPAIQEAMQTAATKGANRSVAEGYGALSPAVTFDPQSKTLVVNRGAGKLANTFPDLRLWDYTQRALRGAVEGARREGNFEQADALGSLHHQLLEELDRLSPHFANARGVAARFFSAGDALEAGEKFVGTNVINGVKVRDPEVARMVASMSPAEQQLFRYGFVTELANRISRLSDSGQVVNKIANSPNARARLQVALGPDGAEEVQALLRIEGLVDRARTVAFGNSSSVQQLGDVGAYGAMAAFGGEAARLNPVAWITGAILYAGRQLHHSVNEEVATNVARMLVSEDPAVYARGVAIAARNPIIRETLRRASDLSTRELIDRAGPYTAAAGLAAGASRLTGYGKPSAEPQQHHYYEESPQQGVSSFQQGP